MSRPTWDEYFMGLAFKASEKATCSRALVGAFIAKDNAPISTGYNGSPSGQPHCIDVGCLIKHNHCVRTVHAEENALLFAGRDRTMRATLYTTHQPCYHCASLIINAGISRVVFSKVFGFSDSVVLLGQAGIIVDQLEIK